MTRSLLAARLRRPRRWRRRLFTLLTLMLCIAAGGWFITRPHRLAKLTAVILEHLTGGEVTIESAHLFANGQLDLEQVMLRIPGLPAGPQSPGQLFEAARVQILPDTAGLLAGRMRIASIVLDQPTLHLTQDLQSGRYNYQSLPRPQKDGSPDGARWLPDVFIHAGTVRFAQVNHGMFQELTAQTLEGRLTQDDPARSAYSFTLRQGLDPADPDLLLHGTFDLDQRQFSAQLAGFAFSSQHRRMMPVQVRRVWDRLDPEGALPTVTVSYTHDPAGTLHAEWEVQGVALNLPVREIDARLSNVTGRFVLHGEALTLINVTGALEGIHCTLNGTIHGLDRDAPLQLHARTQPFILPENPHYLSSLPEPVLKQYNRFSPSGRFQVEMTFSRPTQGAPLAYDGVIDLLGARGHYQKFAYPVEDIHGQIHLNNKTVTFDNLRGRGPNGGRMTARGSITPPGKGPAVQITVLGEDVPIDEHLLAAMEPPHRRAFDLFFNEQAYRGLVAQDVIRPGNAAMPAVSDEAQGSESKALPFDLGGTLDMRVEVERKPGPGMPTQAITTLNGTGVRLLFKHWPYPLEVAGGEVTITPRSVHVHNLKLRGLTGGGGTVTGTVDRAPNNKGVTPRLTITDAQFPLDDLLLASIPSPQNDWVRAMGLVGTFQASGSVFTRDDGRPDFTLNFTPVDAQITPFGGAITLDHLTGQVTLRHDIVQIDHLTGHHNQGTLTTTGRIAWANHKPGGELRFSAANLAIERELLDLLPPQHPSRAPFAALFDRYQPAGRVDVDLLYPLADSAPAEFDLTLRPKTVAFDFGGERIALTEMTGSVQVLPGSAELLDLTGRFPHGSLAVSGLVGLDEGGGAALSLTAQADRIDATARAFLPDAVRQMIDALTLVGGYRLDPARLVIRPTAEQEPRIEFDGQLHLINASAALGVPITDLDGQLDLRVTRNAEEPTPQVALTLKADKLRIADRLVQPMSLNLANSEETPALQLTDLHGKVYGGVLTGSGTFPMQRDARYNLELALQGVAVKPFLAPPPATAPSTDEAASQASEGRLSSSLTLEAVYGQPATRHGRGAMEVRDADFFERPLAMALLQTANLSLPVSNSFDRASAAYLIDGNDVHFEQIRLETPSAAIAGTGRMNIDTRKLDLTMFARNPAAPRLGVLSEMLNVFKDQLICIEVAGTLMKPQARLVSFEGVRDSIEHLFGGTPSKPVAPR